MAGAMAGVVRRRLLVNFRAPADAVAAGLPDPMRPKLHRGDAVVGVCLIRLERLRPALVPLPIGVAAEYAAHRVAVEWDAPDGSVQQGVFIPRRDSAAWMHRIGLPVLSPVRLFPARFDVEDDGARVRVAVDSEDGQVRARFAGGRAAGLPDTSGFASLGEASRFFEEGERGYSPSADEGLDGVALQAGSWKVEPLATTEATSTYFERGMGIRARDLRFDCALAMRDTPHRWVRAEPPGPAGGHRSER